ncbi:NAD(P)H nitroreductase [Thorsellia anophelis]|uniref:Putative NAD(P)H nitroreductase n=1 Tax=Thorsellia anophelis DSM 18579 TaxID=1123402 RepID=A0A1I0C062_9GAMM|nr:NAD(P)H nitroreductase [Thorsellia anophelis]SET12757.1 Nitroreductase [Thorsellia anophelis DSM 18579]
MQAIDLLLKRQSQSKLITPAPSGQSLELILQAGLRAPDHGHLTPWRFVIIQNEGLDRLSDLFVQTVCSQDSDKKQRAASLPYRAPMIIAVIAKVVDHPKVPYWEQIVSAGCAVQAMQMAAFALGFGGIWRSGDWCDNEIIRTAFNCMPLDKIVGYLYLGTPEGALAKLPEINTEDYTEYL